MCKLTLIIAIIVVLIVIEVIIFYHHFETQDDRDQHRDQLFSAIAVTVLIGLALIFVMTWNRSGEQEYGFFKKKDKKVVPPVYVPEARKTYGNPMKKPTYNISSKYQEPVDASKLYGGAAAAADINRRPLQRKK